MATRNTTQAKIIGEVFYANADGADPEHINNTGLVANGMYIRLRNSDNTYSYISASAIGTKLTDIDAVSKTHASKASVDAISSQIENKATKTELSNLQGIVNTKVSSMDIESLHAAIDSKADTSDIDEMTEEIESINAEIDTKESIENVNAVITRVASLESVITEKADNTQLESINAEIDTKESIENVNAVITRVASLEEDVNDLKGITDYDNLNAIQNQITELNNSINQRFTEAQLKEYDFLEEDVEGPDGITITKGNSYLKSLKNDLEEINESVDDIFGDLDNKASKTWVEEKLSPITTNLANAIAAIETKADSTDIAGKADQADLVALSDIINGKIVEDGENIIGLVEKVANLETADDDNYEALVEQINLKANTSDLTDAISTINSALDLKANTSDVNESITDISDRMTALEAGIENQVHNYTGEYIEDFKCEIKNDFSIINNNINSQAKQITTQGNNISKLQESNNNYNEKLKQNWVRVLSTREYKRLLPNPPEGIFNNNYKYPNTVYLVVDFNKPKAIYIGDILIAKAEQSGSIGFAYTFPIVF